jgi:CheY-like chemotaxis protein
LSSPQRRILLVDDEPEVLAILSEYLGEQGFTVHTVMNGHEALLEAKRWTPTAVVLDLLMPKLGGLEALDRIRQINPGIVVILISGQSRALDLLTTAEVRVAGVFPKPLNLPELLATLVQAGVSPIRRRPQPAHTARNAYESAQVPASIVVVDDEPDVREVLAEYLEIKGFDVRQAASGEEALEKVGESCPDVVLLDLGLPGLSGIETLRRLKIAGPRSCVIVVSGNQDLELAQTARTMGAAEYVPKPVDFGYLESILSIHTQTDQIGAR